MSKSVVWMYEDEKAETAQETLRAQNGRGAIVKNRAEQIVGTLSFLLGSTTSLTD
jgi:hypothetical protein